MFTAQFTPAPIHDFVRPGHELPSKFLIERPEIGKDLDDIECSLAIEINGMELIDYIVD